MKICFFKLLIVGIGLMPAVPSPAQPVVKIASTGGHDLLLKSDGSLWGMGLNDYGQLGVGDSQQDVHAALRNRNRVQSAGMADEILAHVPTNIPGFQEMRARIKAEWEGTNTWMGDTQLIVSNGVTAIAVGNERSFFVKADGSLWAMGDNGAGFLGDGTLENAIQPKQIVVGGVVDVAAGENHTVFLKDDGSLWGFGYNMHGQLGDGNENNVVTLPEKLVANGVTAIAAGMDHSLFLKSDGSLWGMGGNISGQLGDGTDKDSLRPKQIVAGNVVGITAGSHHSLFIKNDGSLWAMGRNDRGQLGDCTSNDTNLPIKVVAKDVTAVAGGEEGSLLLKNDGSLWAMGLSWGYNYGDGISFHSECPVQLTGGKNAPLVANYYYSAALKNTVSVWARSFKNSRSPGTGRHGTDLKALPAATNLPGSNLITIELLNDGQVRLSYEGTAGVNYALDRAYSLTSSEWFPQCTNTASDGGKLIITNKPNTTENNFWRIRSVP